MNYRHAVLLSAEDCTTDGTKTIDLKGLDPISKLQIQLKGLNSTSTPVAHPAAAVTKIEIVDGSDVLHSLTGYEEQALDFYNNGVISPELLNYVNDEYFTALLQVNFGRWLWDEDLAFDPSRFKNPQLKITHDISAGGSNADAGTLDVNAELFDERKISPSGFMMAKEYNAYTLSASAAHVVEMPTDYVMRQMMLQSLYSGNYPYQQYHDLKLSENNGKKIVIDDSVSDLIKYLLAGTPTVRERVRSMITTGVVSHYVAPTYNVGVWGSERLTDAGAFYCSTNSGGIAGVAGGAAGQGNWEAVGQCPHGALSIPFGDPWDANMWYDVTKLAKLDLTITAGSGASGTVQIVTEQLRRY